MREIALVAGTLLALIVVQLVSVDGLYLFSRYFWVDELYTYAVAADPGLGHAIQAIHGGMDSMPTYALLLRALSVFAGGPSEVFMRAASLGSIVLALIGVYVLLRPSVTPLVAFAAVLVIWAHPLALTHAFTARFHGPFLAASVWFCVAMDRRYAAPVRARTALSLAVAGLALCAIHVFGVIVWAIVLFAAGLIFRRWGPSWPALVGPVAVPVLWILALQPQRAAVTVPTWEAPFSWAGVADTAGFVLLPEHLGAVFLLGWGVLCVQRLFTPRAADSGSPPPAPALLLLTGLSLLIPALVVVSLLIQPTLTPRYSIPALAALAPAVAYGLARLPRWGTAIIVAVLVVVSTVGLRRNANQARWQDAQTDAVIGAIRQLPADAPVVFEVTHVLDVVWRYAPDLRPRLVLLDFEAGQVPDPSPIRIVSRDLARAYLRFYEGPHRISWDTLRSAPEFYLAPDARAYAQPPTAETRYPGFTITPIGPYLAKATRK